MSIRRYNTSSGTELTKRVQEGFLPLVRQLSGFVAYYVVESGGNSWTSISVFETQAQADESTRLARDWARDHVFALSGVPEVASGEVTAHAAKN